MKLGGYGHCTEILPELSVKVRGQGHQGQKRKSAAFCSGIILWDMVLVWHFFQSRHRGCFYAGGKISTCCLVWQYLLVYWYVSAFLVLGSVSSVLPMHSDWLRRTSYLWDELFMCWVGCESSCCQASCSTVDLQHCRGCTHDMASQTLVRPCGMMHCLSPTTYAPWLTVQNSQDC